MNVPLQGSYKYKNLTRPVLICTAGPLFEMAGATRLELATSGVTGRRYNRLNYAPMNRNAFTRIIPGCPAGNATPDETEMTPAAITAGTVVQTVRLRRKCFPDEGIGPYREHSRR